MKAKCYALFSGEREWLSEYANVSQKNFLSFELASVARKAKRADRIEL